MAKFFKGFNLQACDFQETLGKANDNDLIYLDPPYVDRKGSKVRLSESTARKDLASQILKKCQN